MKVAYHDYPVGGDYPHVPRSVNEAERIRRETKSACVLFVSPDGTEIMLISECDGLGFSAVRQFACEQADHDGAFARS